MTLPQPGKRKIGIYSGSFNPIHIGHLALANWLCEYTEIDEIWFMITPHNPLKARKDLMDDQLRFLLVEQAIKGYPKFKASRFEFSLPQPTYTIHTLRALREAFPAFDFHFIMGADNWENFHLWVEYESIIREFPLLIYPRKGYAITIPSTYPSVRAVDAPLMEISSSFIRNALKEGKDIRFFLPEAIREATVFTPNPTEKQD